MRIRRARQILKCLADDTRLRIVNLLNREQLNVTELGAIIGKRQPNLSKHLARLRLTGVVTDRREGLNVYYYLRKPDGKTHRELLNSIVIGLAGLKTFKEDIKKLKKIKSRRKKA